eukprot:TRINITY_DN7861_c0_g1_i12.p1 TRINITY_DN7861_c0_g1~~TRINITY_DN7861_c0_g1_i12.p1  ORF type:complete len:295 (+),score=58.79 TRINITY_DN7861_c0_g1_i12:179-1063(+)
MITVSTILNTNLTQKQLIEIEYDLQRQLRAKEAEATKEKAVLAQRINLLEMEIKEGKEREVSMRKMYDTMIRALKPATNNVPKEINLINEMHNRQLAEAKQRQIDLTIDFEKKINNLRASLLEYENERKSMEDQRQQMERVYRAKLEESEARCRELEKRTAYTDHARNQKGVITPDTEAELLEKAKNEHSKELAELNNHHDQPLAEIKQMHEQERLSMKNKLEEANALIKSLQESSVIPSTAVKENCLNGKQGNVRTRFYSTQECEHLNLPSTSAYLHIESFITSIESDYDYKE